MMARFLIDRKYFWLTLLCLPALVAVVGCFGCGDEGDSGSGETPKFVSLGTARPGGAFFSVGAAIGKALDDGSETGGWRKVTAESTDGSLENFRRLDSGELQLAMANSSITYFAVKGEGGFEKKYDVKSVMTLFPLIGMFVTREGSNTTSIEDFKDKNKRIVVGPEGGGFEYFLRPILAAHGVTYDDFEADYAGFQESVGRLQDGNAAAVFLGGGMRSPAISSAASSMDIYLIPYGEKQRDELAKLPSFNKVTVPADTYKGQDEPFAGLNVGSAHLIVRSDASEDFVYNITKIIYEARKQIGDTHKLGKSINAQNVVTDTGTPFHAGAIRYYKEIKIWPKDAAAGKTTQGADTSGK